MAKVTLTSITQSLDAEYGSYELLDGDGNLIAELLNPLRMSPHARTALRDIVDTKSDDNEAEPDVEDTETSIDRLVKIVQIASATEAQFDALIKAISPRGYPDVAALQAIITGYFEEQKVGEASASQN